MALDAIIFDVDGTLVDTNALHVRAFVQAFAAAGYTVLPDRVAGEMGKGGDTLVPSILGATADGRDGKRIRSEQPERFAELAGREGLKPFPLARELLAAVRRRGIRVVIATSSGGRSIRNIERYSGWALTGDADEVVNADDAATSKPAPDLLAAAVARTGLSPAQCAMVGDTPYDATSAAGAGVVTLGVTCGGNSADVLRTGGARKVYRDAEHVLTRLDEAITVCSPSAAHLTRSTLEFLMGEALAAAREGMADGGLPVGAVLARGDGSVLARGYNQSHRTGDRTRHAEMVALSDAGGRLTSADRDLILATTLEPCAMCAGAAMQLAVDTVVFGPHDPVNGGVRRVVPPTDGPSQLPRYVGGIRSDESLDLFRRWLAAQGDAAGPRADFVRRLLAGQAAKPA